jgi:hypothetical protein
MTDSSQRQDQRQDQRQEEEARDRADLAALLDGELSPAREAELRARMAERPELAEELALMGEADQQLRELAGLPVSEDRLARMRSGLDAKLAAAAAAPRGGATVIALPMRPRWLAAAAAALAAGLALYLATDRPPTPQSAPDVEQLAGTPTAGAEQRIVIDAPPSDSPKPRVPAAPVHEEPALARVPEAVVTPAPLEPSEATELASGQAPVPVVENAAVEPEALLDIASEEEIAIAIDYETLADFDVIARLDLLELLDDLDTVEAM